MDKIRAEEANRKSLWLKYEIILKVWLAIFTAVPCLSQNNAAMHVSNLINGVPVYGRVR